MWEVVTKLPTWETTSNWNDADVTERTSLWCNLGQDESYDLGYGYVDGLCNPALGEGTNMLLKA